VDHVTQEVQTQEEDQTIAVEKRKIYAEDPEVTTPKAKINLLLATPEVDLIQEANPIPDLEVPTAEALEVLTTEILAGLEALEEATPEAQETTQEVPAEIVVEDLPMLTNKQEKELQELEVKPNTAAEVLNALMNKSEKE